MTLPNDNKDVDNKDVDKDDVDDSELYFAELVDSGAEDLQASQLEAPDLIRRGSPFREHDAAGNTTSAKQASLHFAGSSSENSDELIPMATLVVPGMHQPAWMPHYENYVARGGAVAALFLGVMSILGGLITPVAVLNAIAGILLGCWGLTSNLRRVAIAGIALSGIGLFVPLIFLLFI